MDKKERQTVIEMIKKDVCKTIGCSGLSINCKTQPQYCNIVRKIYLPIERSK